MFVQNACSMCVIKRRNPEKKRNVCCVHDESLEITNEQFRTVNGIWSKKSDEYYIM